MTPVQSRSRKKLASLQARFLLVLVPLFLALAVPGLLLVTHYRTGTVGAQAGGILQWDVALPLVALIALAAIAAAAVGFRFVVYSPLQDLLGALRHANETGERIFVRVRGTDEFAILGEAFNDLVSREGQRELELEMSNAALRQSQDSLKKLNQQLEERIAERTAELKAAKERAEASDRSKSQFLASMSHELRTPLNAIIGFSDIIESEMYGPLGDPQYLDYVQDINRSGQHLLQVINDVLDISKIEAGAETLNESGIDVLDMIQSVFRLMRPHSTAAGVDLHIDDSAGSFNLVADPVKLKQILINLLSNAIKFTPEGGEVRIAAHVGEHGEAVIAVSDTGIGMKEEDIPVALSMFGQAGNATTKYEARGTGLGLPLCKALVELHGGRLEIESALGKGTTVAACLPPERLVKYDTAVA